MIKLGQVGEQKWVGNDLAGLLDHKMVIDNTLCNCYYHHSPSTECRDFVGTFGKPHWFDNVREEHNNCRNKVCVFDMTSFAKFEVEVSQVMVYVLLESIVKLYIRVMV